MANDVCEVAFNEKDLYTGDVAGEDDDDEPLSPPPPTQSAVLAGAGPATSSTNGDRPSRALARAAGGGAKSGGAGGKAGGGGAAAERRRRRAAERAQKIVYWLETKYDVLHDVCADQGEMWKESPSATYDFDLLWCDTAIPADRFMKLKQYQKMNHFVGMSSITRKNNLGRNLLRMRKQFPKEYKFFPDTWILPTDLSDFKQQFPPGKSKTFIIKPDNGCQGKGIFLIRDVEKVPVDFSQTYVAQRYITKPFLLDGYKFDLRLYVLVAGCDPLRIFMHKRGLVRLATEEYVEPSGKNISQTMVHLTNYAVNKMNPNFEENTNPDDAQDGHKRSWEAVLRHLRDEGHDVDKLITEIEDLVIKTLIAVQPSLSHFYHSCQPDECENAMCFEVLGFDVMLDHKLQPWLLEVNHAPSFQTESELDRVVKYEVLKDTLRLLDISPEARRQKKREAREKMEQRAMGALKKQSLEERAAQEKAAALERTRWEDDVLTQGSGYKRLYPSEAKEQEYMHIHDAAISIWEMLMGGTSRRPVQLGPEREDDPKDAKKGVGDSKNKLKQKQADEEEKPEPSPKEKRTQAELQEVVERLTAGCSARPRATLRWQRGAKSAKEAAGAGVAPPPGAEGHAAMVNEVVNEVLKQDQRPMTSSTSSSKKRFDVQVGDKIKVQTNLGWETVTVIAKRVNGKLDIEFKDGEYMRSVLPRILKEEATEQKSAPGDQPAAAGSASGGSTAASSGPNSTTGDSTSGSSTSSSSQGLDKAHKQTSSPLWPQADALTNSDIGAASALLPSQPSLPSGPGGLTASLGGGGGLAAAHSAPGLASTLSALHHSPRRDTSATTYAEEALHALDQQVSTHLRAKINKRGNVGMVGGARAPEREAEQQLAGTASTSVGAGRNARGASSLSTTSESRFQLQHLISVRPIVTGTPARPPAVPSHDAGDRVAHVGWSALMMPPGSAHRAGSMEPRPSFGRRATYTSAK